MRTLKYYIATSVDGFILHADGAIDGFLMGGEHLADFDAWFSSVDTVLMGRKTYDMGLSFGVTNPYPGKRQIVFSRSLTSTDPAVEVVSDDPIATARRLKAEPGGDIWLCGGAELAGQLLDAGLIDEVIVKQNPVLFGAGTSLFAGARRTPLRLLRSKSYDNGVVVQAYAT